MPHPLAILPGLRAAFSLLPLPRDYWLLLIPRMPSCARCGPDPAPARHRPSGQAPRRRRRRGAAAAPRRPAPPAVGQCPRTRRTRAALGTAATAGARQAHRQRPWAAAAALQGGEALRPLRRGGELRPRPAAVEARRRAAAPGARWRPAPGVRSRAAAVRMSRRRGGRRHGRRRRGAADRRLPTCQRFGPHEDRLS